MQYQPDDERLGSKLLARENLCLMVPAQVDDVGWAALVRLGYIHHPAGMNMVRRLLARVYPGGRIDQLPVRWFTNHIGAILDPVAHGPGFTVLPRFAVQACPRRQAIQVLDTAAPVIDSLWLVSCVAWPLSASAAWALAQLRKQDWLACAGALAP